VEHSRTCNASGAIHVRQRDLAFCAHYQSIEYSDPPSFVQAANERAAISQTLPMALLDVDPRLIANRHESDLNFGGGFGRHSRVSGEEWRPSHRAGFGKGHDGLSVA
jgi:hypothetical protein